jgi:hypothetical protein
VRVWDNYTNVARYVDGQIRTSGNYYYLYPADYTAKTHSLTVRGISWDGIPYSWILTFTVADVPWWGENPLDTPPMVPDEPTKDSGSSR